MKQFNARKECAHRGSQELFCLPLPWRFWGSSPSSPFCAAQVSKEWMKDICCRFPDQLQHINIQETQKEFSVRILNAGTRSCCTDSGSFAGIRLHGLSGEGEVGLNESHQSCWRTAITVAGQMHQQFWRGECTLHARIMADTATASDRGSSGNAPGFFLTLWWACAAGRWGSARGSGSGMTVSGG